MWLNSQDPEFEAKQAEIYESLRECPCSIRRQENWNAGIEKKIPQSREG
jgi:hypothetical protein